MIDPRYKKQVKLLLRILPEIAREESLALHGGTAVNLFYKNMPRLSVDLDLTWLPFDDRESDLQAIREKLISLRARVAKNIPGINAHEPVIESEEYKMRFTSSDGSDVKVEVNTINRGVYDKPVLLSLCSRAQEMFEMYCEIQVVPFGQLYGGKIAAALDRQHPRDLFDIKTLLDNTSYDDDLKKGVLFCLLSSKRPLHELLEPSFLDLRRVLETQFGGMTDQSFTYDMFEATRNQLIDIVRKGITEEGNTFYEDKHNLLNGCDFVMASSASDAGHSEKEIREKLIKTGAVDVMMAIGNNFFYTRSLPCTLWFFDRAKEQNKQTKDQILMLDARKIYRKGTSKVNDFSPEQLQNLICIVNLYRGNTEKFETTVKRYLETSAELARQTADATTLLQKQLQKVVDTVTGFAIRYARENENASAFADSLIFEEASGMYEQQNKLVADISRVSAEIEILENIALQCKTLRKPQDKLIKQLLDIIAGATKEHQLNKIKDWKELNLKEQLDQLKALQQQLSGNPDEEEPGLLHETEYFWRQAHWLQSRFPAGSYTDVEGLCKVVTQSDIAAKDWSLSPGRYVGVDAAIDDGVDYEERLREIHIELEGLNDEAIALANTISENFKSLL